MPTLYTLLFEIGAIRSSLTELRGEMSSADAERFLSRLDLVETNALRLLGDAEQQANVAAH